MYTIKDAQAFISSSRKPREQTTLPDTPSMLDLMNKYLEKHPYEGADTNMSGIQKHLRQFYNDYALLEEQRVQNLSLTDHVELIQCQVEHSISQMRKAKIKIGSHLNSGHPITHYSLSDLLPEMVAKIEATLKQGGWIVKRTSMALTISFPMKNGDVDEREWEKPVSKKIKRGGGKGMRNICCLDQ
jgi:hypothetical protein